MLAQLGQLFATGPRKQLLLGGASLHVAGDPICGVTTPRDGRQHSHAVIPSALLEPMQDARAECESAYAPARECNAIPGQTVLRSGGVAFVVERRFATAQIRGEQVVSNGPTAPRLCTLLLIFGCSP